ncbi:MAG: hypothetical protein HY791_07800 [Deltaproteobacteria bacterium]|nr:hypothetical protein [Deltaproteobacteria bacterium]
MKSSVGVCLLTIMGCSSVVDAPGDGVLRTTIPLKLDGKPIEVGITAGVPLRVTPTIEAPAEYDYGKVVKVTVDLQATLSHVKITKTGALPPNPEVSFKLGVAPKGSDACAGEAKVEVKISGDTSFENRTITPSTVSAPTQMVELVNSGTFAACTELLANFDAMTSLDGIVAELELAPENCDKDPEDIHGTWAGPYTCTPVSTCGAADSGDVTLTILQSGKTAMYFDDGGAIYFGSVCGDEFTFAGGRDTYFEYGRFRKSDGSKRSTYFPTLNPTCGGDCTDELTLNL